MKGKSYYGLLITIIIIGISSFNFYQHKQEERLLEFEGYEISAIEERVDALYNEEKTDIVEGIAEDELEELEQLFLDLDEKDLHKENKRRIRDMEVDFLLAREMNTIQEDIRALFDKKIVVSSAELKDFNRLEREIEPYSIRSDYYERNMELLTDGKQQLTNIREAEELVESLLDEEGNLKEGVTQDDIDEALKIIEKIKNEEIRDALTASLDGEIIPVEEEEDEEEVEEIEEVEETPEVEEPESTPTRPSRPTQPTNPIPGNNNNPGSSNGNTGGGSGSGTGGGNTGSGSESGSGGGNTDGASGNGSGGGNSGGGSESGSGEGNTDGGSGNGSSGGNPDGTGSGSDSETGSGNNSNDGEDEPDIPVTPTPKPEPEQPAEPEPENLDN